MSIQMAHNCDNENTENRQCTYNHVQPVKAPHLESIIKTQRIMVCKRFADEEPCAWKTILSHYLKPVGDKIILL